MLKLLPSIRAAAMKSVVMKTTFGEKKEQISSIT